MTDKTVRKETEKNITTLKKADVEIYGDIQNVVGSSVTLSLARSNSGGIVVWCNLFYMPW